MSSPIVQALNAICEEKNISKEVVIHTLEAALAAAYRKDFGLPNQNIKVEFNPENGEVRVFDVKIVMEKPPEPEEGEEPPVEQLPGAPISVLGALVPNEAGLVSVEESEKPRWHPRLHLTPEEAQVIKANAQEGDEIRRELEVPSAYGRMAAQTAKQVIIQKLREAEREVVFNEYKDKEKQVLVGTIGQREGRMILVDLGKTTALLSPEGQIQTENYVPGQRMKFYIEAVNLKTRGAEILVSRTSPELVRYLFNIEIPEIQHGTVEIVAIAREAGSRTKIAVKSTAPNIDPVGSCVGQRGSRVQTIITELGGEKIDIIEWSEDTDVYLRHALSPAKIVKIELVTNEQRAMVFVNEDQLSLAIGRGGQNVRLASRLTGWRIDIRQMEGSEVVETSEEVEVTQETEEVKEEDKVGPTEAPVEESTDKDAQVKESPEDQSTSKMTND